MGELVTIERNLTPMMPKFEAFVEPCGLNARRFMHSVLEACERNPRLLEFEPIQHARFAMTSAVLALEPGGPTGQIFPVPFGGRNPVIQSIVGYKGFNTVAERAGITIHGDVLREGDEFDPVIEPGRAFRVRQSFGNRHNAVVIGAWAQAVIGGRPGAAVIMDASELAAVQAKSAGARKPDSPWNDRNGPGFAAMCAKTAKRRLQRSLPMVLTRGLEGRNVSQHTLAAAVDELPEERGLHGYLNEDAAIVEGHSLYEPEPENESLWVIETSKGPSEVANAEEYIARWQRGFAKATPEQIAATLARNQGRMDALREAGHDDVVSEVIRSAGAQQSGEDK